MKIISAARIQYCERDPDSDILIIIRLNKFNYIT